MKTYTILGWVTMITVPIAPAFFFGWLVYTAVLEMTAQVYLAAPVGVLSAVGLELVGIIAGHTAMEFWRRGDTAKTITAALIMAVYVVIGVVELWGNIGMVFFLISPLAYVLVALRHILDGHEAKENGRNDWELSEATKDRQLRRDLAMKAQEDKTAVTLAKLSHDTAVSAPAVGTNNGTVSRTETGHFRADWRTLPPEERDRIKSLSPVEIVNLYKVNRKTADRWLEKVGQSNGHLR